MDFIDQTRFIERLQFFDNQRLFAADLQGVEAFNREMRWLHNQSLHQPGIGNGFAVTGRKGEREVVVGPGYAIDGEGREIVLTQDVTEPVPPVSGEEDGSPAVFDLTIVYDPALEETERREGVCRQPGGTIRLREKPAFCWVRLRSNLQPEDDRVKAEIASGARLVLARAEVLNCRLEKDLSIAQRLSARPARQPYVCCGTAEPDWRPWTLVPFEPQQVFGSSDAGALFGAGLNRQLLFPVIMPLGLTAEVDTSRCGFLTTPCYSARIAGPRVKQYTTRVVVGRARVTGVAGVVVVVDDAGPFRAGDAVTGDGVSSATVNGIQGNRVTLSRALPVAAGDSLRLADISPARLAFRVSNAAGFSKGMRVQLRGERAGSPGAVVSEFATVGSSDPGADVVTLASPPTNTYNLNVTAERAPVLVAQAFTVVVDGLVQVRDPRPDGFTAEVLLVAQLSLAPSAFTPGVPLMSSNIADEAAASARVEEAARSIIRDNFADWQLVWLGVEG